MADREKATNGYLAFNWLGAGVALLLMLSQWSGSRGFVFNGLLFIGSKAVFYKILIIVAWIFTLFHLKKLKYRFPPELYILLTGAVLAACLLCMSVNLLTVYLGIELLSLTSYLLVALSPTPKASEGGLKYLLFGTVSSAVMLYGISFIYGLTGTLDLSDETIRTALSANAPLVTYLTMLLTLGGLFFKLSLVPFHIWTPDVYEAAPTPIISFLSVVPKIAVLLVLMRFAYIFPDPVLLLLGGVALLSMTVGNVAALGQRNARRMLAYSTISQAGYLLVGVVALSATGFETATFYVTSYLILNMTAFFLVDVFTPQSDTAFSGFHGKGALLPVAGVAMTVVMVALAGFPPTIGFTAKWLIFTSLWESYQLQGDTWRLVLLAGGILNAAIAMAYYLKIPYLLYFKPKPSAALSPDRWMPVIAGTLLLVIIWMFVRPSLFLDVIETL